MKSKEYFEKRSIKVEDHSYKAAMQTKKKIKKLFKQSEENIQAKIDKLYRKYAKDLKIDMATAMQYIKGNEFEEWRMSLEEYVDKLKATGDPKLYKEIETLTKRTRIRRLEALQSEVRAEANLLYSNNLTLFDKTLGDEYKYSYYNTSYNIQNGAEIYFPVAAVDQDKIKLVLSYKNQGENFSKRIWNHRDKLAKDVQDRIAQSFATASTNREMAKAVSERFGVSYNNSIRLIRTESNFYNNQGTLESYKECDIEMYEYLATLDKRTSTICRELDGKVFKRSQAQAGTNLPPMHPNCRSTTVPEIDGGYPERIARDKGEKNVYVEGSMTYKEWEQTMID